MLPFSPRERKETATAGNMAIALSTSGAMGGKFLGSCLFFAFILSVRVDVVVRMPRWDLGLQFFTSNCPNIL